MKTFAAIDVGSYEQSMKIYTISKAGGIREVDCIRNRLDLGSDTYITGKVSQEKMDELCRVLREFVSIMEGYRVDDYRAYGTSAIREIKNTVIVLDQIMQRTGLKVEVLSNSEQRFLDYKSIASRGEGFEKIIEKGTIVADIGGGSIQLSLFDKDKLSATQNLRLGVLRLQERLQHLNVRPSCYDALLDELLFAQLSVFKKMYLKDRNIENIIVVDDYISELIRSRLTDPANRGYADGEALSSYLEYLKGHTDVEIAKRFDMPEENVQLLRIASAIVRQVAMMTDAKLVWAPGVTLCDGMAYEYAESHRMLAQVHDFEQDIVTCARGISKRFMGSKRRGETLEQISLTIFDSMKRVHGMGKRERLLLRIAALLHDCGKYISMLNLSECAYSIIMATEIIGLSHREREIVANVVKYNHQDFEYEMVSSEGETMERTEYLTIAKLTAILRISNALDRSHKQKCRDIRVARREDELVITVNTSEDITLEKGLFDARAEFFKEVYSILPVIRQKRLP
ncbi:MAG: HD domain-containing protein [Eubacteriales bacterium]|nr:HD domain-containing protein [Eubacteriales bacterium]